MIVVSRGLVGIGGAGWVRPAVTYTVPEAPVLEGDDEVGVLLSERIVVAAFPWRFPTPVNQTLIYPVPPPKKRVN